MQNKKMAIKKQYKILIVSANYPIPPDDGYKVRNYNLYKNLTDNFEFTWLSFGRKREQIDLKQLGTSCKNLIFISDLTIKKIVSNRSYIKKLLYPEKISIGLPKYSDAMHEAVNKEIRSKCYDAIIFSGYYMFSYAEEDDLIKTPYVVDIMDSISILTWSYFCKENNIKKKLKAFFNYIWALRFEKLLFGKIKNMITVSEKDTISIEKKCTSSEVRTITNGVDTSYFKNENDRKVSNNTLLFTGVLNYKPNNDSIIYFIKRIFPIIKSKVNDVKLVIAGPNASDELIVLSKKDKSIHLLGYVEDIRTAFYQADVYISPLISGAGVKNKILEAWAMSIPIVATSLSCYGLNAKNEKNVLIANQPEEFAEAIYTLLCDETLRYHLSRNGRRNVEKNYSWSSKSQILESYLKDIIRKHYNN